MKSRMLNLRASGLAAAAFGALFLAGCDGSSSQTASGRLVGTGAVLESVRYGRLVDIYAYRRVDPTRADRRDTFNRNPVLVATDVVVNPELSSDQLFDAIGEENASANFRFMPFDVRVGHEELVILWDDQLPAEAGRFADALDRAQSGLLSVPGANRGQNTALFPTPVVPRNAALVLTFDEEFDISSSFFELNPSALQVLEFRADPTVVAPPLALLPLPRRVIPRGNQLIVDTSLIGAETTRATTNGLPASEDNVLANIRLALPKGGLLNGLGIGDDPMEDLNSVDMNGDPAVIRDFRSGNSSDPTESLTDAQSPSIVKDAEMAILAATPDDPSNPMSGGILTIDKTGSMLAVRGRVPFVDGGIDSLAALPDGPQAAPTIEPLRSGDILSQSVTLVTGEVVQLRAEILQIEEVGNVIGEPGFPALGRTRSGTDGSDLAQINVRVGSLVGGFDANGNPVSFRGSASGEECEIRVHYYHNVPYSSGQFSVSDAITERMAEFLTFTPTPTGTPINVDIHPVTEVSMTFSEPMDLDTVENLDNFLLANDFLQEVPNVITVAELLEEPKATALSVIATRLVDERGDATVLRLVPPFGLFHEGPNGAGAGVAETYWLHLLGGDEGPADLSGNRIDLYDRRSFAQDLTFSVPFSIDALAPDNLVGSRVLRFESIDEDGTPDGSVDYFGQFQILDGAISGAPVQRFSSFATDQTLGGARHSRWDRGECWDPNPVDPMDPTLGVIGSVFPLGSTAPLWGNLYLCPSMSSSVTGNDIPTAFAQPGVTSVPFGGVLEPHNPRGSRLQMVYHEDDFQLDYTDPAHMNIDLEQLHWSPYENSPVQFDVFDRITIEAAHSDWRPDLMFGSNPPFGSTGGDCLFDCSSLSSGLRPTFADNVLEGSDFVTLVQDKTYQINPNAAIQASEVGGTTFVPYAEFERTYTWRDSRLVTWDMATNRAIGLGGAKQPDGVPPNRDRTAHISSPWIPEPPDPGSLPNIDLFGQPFESDQFPGTIWVSSDADFRGDRVRDHDPIAMPLLLDFKVYADNPSNGVALGINQFHIGYIGFCFSALTAVPGTNPAGYYPGATAAGALPGLTGFVLGCGAFWPATRVHTSGGLDGLNNQREIMVIDPGNQEVASGGWIFDAGIGDLTTGLVEHPGLDDHVQWAKADFVRRVSTVTTGFFDTLAPNRHRLDLTTTSWPGAAQGFGFPDFVTLRNNRGVTYGVKDLVTVIDPPLQTAPVGTSVSVELRGVDNFHNGNVIYNRVLTDRFGFRGNLLNPNYACEAYRYAMPNSGGPDPAMTGVPKNLPRISTTGLTPYVQEDGLDGIRGTNGLLPRYFNLRMVFENDIGPDPVPAPSIRSIGLVYRLTEAQ